MERLIRTSPAYDKRNETPNYGQHCLILHFIVRDEKGALVFSVHTGWYIAQMKETLISGGSFQTSPMHVNCEVSLHRRAELFDCADQDPVECKWIDDQCIGSTPFGFTGKVIGDLFFTLLTESIDRLWEELERHHEELLL